MIRKSITRRSDGSVALETALVIVPFMLIFLAVFELAMAFVAENVVQAAASEASHLGSTLSDPATVISDWGSRPHVFPFASQVQLSAECYSSVADLIAASAQVACGNAHVVKYNASMTWEVMTPMIAWFVPGGFGLKAVGIAYR